MKIWNLTVMTANDGAKTLDVQIHGVIDGGWLDDSSTSTAEIANALAEHQDAQRINVHINSVGGSLFGGVALYNILQAHGAEVTVFVDGLAASAASLIAMAGRTVMGRGSMLMIHNPLAIVMGDAADMRRTAAVLDKARDSLLAIYKAKTGKDGGELKAMLDAETWLTAEQAVRQGFADEIAEGGEEAAAPLVEDLGDRVIFNSTAFPREALSQVILAMATRPDLADLPPSTPVNLTPPGGSTPAPLPPITVDSTAPSPLAALVEQAPMSRAELEASAPELLAALIAEGRAAERLRLQEIDELGLVGCGDMVHAAKYVAPIDARDLAVAAIKASKVAGLELLEARRLESADAASVRHVSPEKKTEASQMEAAKQIAEFANRRRGGR